MVVYIGDVINKTTGKGLDFSEGLFGWERSLLLDQSKPCNPLAPWVLLCYLQLSPWHLACRLHRLLFLNCRWNAGSLQSQLLHFWVSVPPVHDHLHPASAWPQHRSCCLNPWRAVSRAQQRQLMDGKRLEIWCWRPAGWLPSTWLTATLPCWRSAVCRAITLSSLPHSSVCAYAWNRALRHSQMSWPSDSTSVRGEDQAQ